MMQLTQERVARSRSLALGVLLATLMAACLLVMAKPAQAATFTVDRTDDPDPATAKACTDAANDCSLRGAIVAANAAAGADVITVPAGTYTLTRDGRGEDAASTGDLDITDAVAINGAGAGGTIIDANGADRVFEIGSGTASISGVTVKGGRNARVDDTGGGISVLFGTTLNLNGSTVSGNSGGQGGGIGNGGTLTLNGSTVSGNEAFIGGGIYSLTNLAGTSKTTVTNSTVSGNTVPSLGGGIYNNLGLTTIEHSTITNNTAPSGQGSGVQSAANTSTRTEVLSSIVSANANTDVDFLGNTPTNSFSSKGFNLIGDGSATAAFNQQGDQTGAVNALLGPLANNGGPTQTHALQTGSPAIDAGPSSCPVTDQRGVIRQDGDGNGSIACDIGAFEKDKEVAPPPPPPPPPPNTAPVITADVPTKTKDKTPSFSASVTDGESELASEDISVFVDDVALSSFSYDPSTGQLSFTSQKLKKGGHTLRLEATDGTLSASESFSFEVKKKKKKQK